MRVRVRWVFWDYFGYWIIWKFSSWRFLFPLLVTWPITNLRHQNKLHGEQLAFQRHRSSNNSLKHNRHGDNWQRMWLKDRGPLVTRSVLYINKNLLHFKGTFELEHRLILFIISGHLINIVLLYFTFWL